jgi:hypothetical protein
VEVGEGGCAITFVDDDRCAKEMRLKGSDLSFF